MKPSPALCARLRFTTKEVGRGFYRGNRTGSMGAHTEYGGYLIDWRKVRNYVVPDLTDFKLTPFVTKEMEPTSRQLYTEEGVAYIPKSVDAMEYLRTWKRQNPQEYDELLKFQEEQRQEKQDAEARQKWQEEMDLEYYKKIEAQQVREEMQRKGRQQQRAAPVSMNKSTLLDASPTEQTGPNTAKSPE